MKNINVLEFENEIRKYAIILENPLLSIKQDINYVEMSIDPSLFLMALEVTTKRKTESWIELFNITIKLKREYKGIVFKKVFKKQEKENYEYTFLDENICYRVII